MSWEMRNGAGPYYTRSRRIRGRVVREYVGRGLAAELQASRDAEARSIRAARRAKARSEQQAAIDLRASVTALSEEIHGLLVAMLKVSGYHEHRGQWRRRR